MITGQRKVPLQLPVDAALLDRARVAGVDLAKAAEAGISQAVDRACSRSAEQAKWLNENKDAFESLRRHSEEHGLPMARYRQYPWPDSTST